MEFEKEFVKNLIVDEDFTIDEIKNCVRVDYENLIDLRNRIANGTDDDTTLYEEDHLTLDHVLDYMEIIMEFLKMGRIE